MTHEQQALWQRIRDFGIDAPDASFPFSARLASENGWTPAHAARVVEEYRRFAFLAVASGHGATPSKAVDAAWHLHLLYTRNYWDEFCPLALGQRLHHHPSGGAAKDEAKYEGWYEATLGSYRTMFGEEPPADVWPRNEAPAKRRRWWPFLALLALAGCGEGPNPLDWHGPEFLGLFAVLYGVGIVAALVVRRLALGPPHGPPADEWRLHVYEQACLNGGGPLALATALAHLAAQNALEIDRKTGRMRATTATADHPLERAILRAAGASGGVLYGGVAHRARPILDDMERTLRRQGLWVESPRLAAATLIPFALASLPPLLGAAKILVGIDRDRPVGFLVLGCLAGLAVNVFLLVSPKRSPYGAAVLARYRDARPNPAYRRSQAEDDLAFGVALYGLDALRGGEYAYLQTVLTPASTLSGGDGGGSSGCGGGGGGCGGGCGGCGS